MDANVPPVRAVSESVREREAFKFASHLLVDNRYSSTGKAFDTAELKASRDSVLTALAQLAVYQTGADRGFVSLFDSTHQFIVAEATRMMPLIPNLPSDQCPEPLSLCGNAIPRASGTCEHVLFHMPNPSSDRPDDAHQLPLSLVPDLSADPRFSESPYCQPIPGAAGQFYAGVPIRTRKGINIGALCVRKSTDENFWNEQCTRSMRGISSAISDHLETGRLTLAYRRNERMNRGLGSFIEGKSTLSGWQLGPNVAAFVDDAKLEGALDATQQSIEQEDRKTSMSPTTVTSPRRANWNDRDAIQSVNLPTSRRASEATDGTDSGIDESKIVFSKLANLVREAFEVAGCVFCDVTLGSYVAPKVSSPLKEFGADEIMPQQVPSDRSLGSSSSSSGSSDEQPATSPYDTPDAICEFLGFSTTDASSLNAANLPSNEAMIPTRFLAKLLRRYPNGKIFNFDAMGELQASDSSDDDDKLGAFLAKDTSAAPQLRTTRLDDGRSNPSRRNQGDRRFSRMKEGLLIHTAFPAARSVAFMPVWDSKRERWFAGGFVYTNSPTRTFTMEGELSFLKAFTRLASSEIHNYETMQADQAKSDALGALSHELRSPLHGVILGTELLNDTDLTVFQGNATHTIETCCRTLLDTIDHLLDYSKINSFAAKKQTLDGKTSQLRKQPMTDQFGKKALYSHIRLDGLVEEVAESLFAGFNFQRMSLRQMSRLGKMASVDTDTAARQRLDGAQAMEQLSPDTSQGLGHFKMEFGELLVYVSIDPSCDWMFYLQAGAIRRIVMNLFGNALKYTTRGAILISLAQETTTTTQRSRSQRMVKLTIQDTGKGISDDYLRHSLFKPFAQENEFAMGTGLGLSLVKSIVTHLKGQISVTSQVDVGTTIIVKLPLGQSGPTEEPSQDDKDFEEQVKNLKGLRLRLAGFQSSGQMGVAGARTIVEDICGRTLGLDLISEKQAKDLAPDIVLWSENALPSEEADKMVHISKFPNVVVCQDALTAYERLTRFEAAGLGSVFEFISQPIGPRKLAKSIQMAYRRWMGLRKRLRPRPSTLQRPPGPRRTRSSYGVPLSTEIIPQVIPTPSADRMPSLESKIHPNVEAGEPPANNPSVKVSQPPETASKTDGPSGETDKDKDTVPSQSHVKPHVKPSVVKDKMLLVDDNHINLKVLSAYMGKLGRSYEAVTNGKEAVDAYTANPGQFIGILMDISMPVMDGLEATRRIRALEHKNQIPAISILALTGLSSDNVHQEALESGVDVFLTKPVRLKTLSDVLEARNILSQPQT